MKTAVPQHRVAKGQAKMPESEQNRRERRQKLVVSSGIQWAIVRESVWNWLLYFTTVVFLIGSIQVLRGGPSRPLMEHCQAIGGQVLTLFLVFALLLPKFIYDWFRLSHRFLGPVERVRGALRDLASGKEYTEVRFREDDFWGRMADELNAAVQALGMDRSRDSTACDTRDEEARRQPNTL